MKKTVASPFLFVVVILMFFVSLTSYALDYNITFAATGERSIIDSVIVQNLTQGTTLTVPAGNNLNLNDIPNSIAKQIVSKHAVCVYPNPERDKTIVKFYVEKTGSTQINVFGLDGKKIVGIFKYLFAGDNSFQLSVPKGAYVIRIVGNGYSHAAKVIGQAAKVNKPEIDFLGNGASATLINRENVQLRSVISTTTMFYTEGDHLQFKGVSGNCKTIVMDIPTQSKEVSFNFVDCTDSDNNHYTVVQIGTQVWMVENLKTTKYRNGKIIGTTLPATKDISGEIEPKYQWPYNGDESNVSKYGRLYTCYAVYDSRRLAPIDWHIPTDDEWITLETYLKENGYNFWGRISDNVIAKSLAATTDWNLYSGKGAIGDDLSKNNTSGFSALPGGFRINNGTFDGVGENGYWWTSTVWNNNYTWFRRLYYHQYQLSSNGSSNSDGYYVRCVRD